MPPHDQSRVDIERARVRDLMRYYKPKLLPKKEPVSIRSQDVDKNACENAGGISFPVEQEDAPDDSRLLAHDPTLTAFTQLAAYRLNCERSFISLMDYDHQYIVAEATRSASLLAQDQCEPGDEIYLGPRVLDRVWGVCPSTIQVFTAKDNSLNIATPEIAADQECYIMYDMSILDRFRHRPYVTHWPYMKFYAEVPITSPTGHVIGTFCVVDNKPRYDFDRKGIDTLKEIASAIMNHLDLMEMQRNLRQTDQRLKSLGNFVEKKSLPEDKTPLSELGQDNFAGLMSSRPGLDRTISASSALSGDKSSGHAATTTSTTSPIPMSDCGIVGTPTLPTDDPVCTSDLSVLLVPQERTVTCDGPSSPLERSLSMSEDVDLKETLASNMVRGMFSRACYGLREALELDGVMFIDASFQDVAFDLATPATQQKPTSALNRECENGNKDVENMTGTDQQAKRPDAPRRMSSINVLGSVGRYSSPQVMPRSVLRSLLQRYRDGKIFVFDEDGELLQNTPRMSDAELPMSDAEHEEDKQWAKKLLCVCPGAQSIIFYPLWDTHRHQWLAGCLAWTNDFARMLKSSDLTYMAAFTSCIMSEKSRLDVVAADLQKLDFISSVSHELRNPLHGVLASTEALREMSSSLEQDDLIRTITVCGEVLLDTVDQMYLFHLPTLSCVNDDSLDYAKTTKTTSSTATIEPSKSGALTGADMKRMTTLDMSELVESVVEGVFVGHHFRQSTLGTFSDVSPNLILSPPRSNVIVILSIDWQSSWIYRTQIGALTRIVMNLFGNALKFTEHGRIHVSLSADAAPADSTIPRYITLQIEDSGKGMSQNYMKYHLFSPFVQENHMSVGTGLGLSIVHQLVVNLDGKISVQSELNQGTTMKVTVPLDSPSEFSPLESIDLIDDIKQRCGGLKLCLIGFDHYPDLAEEPTGMLSSQSMAMIALKKSLSSMATDWFQMEVSTSPTLASSDGDLTLILRSKVASLGDYVIERPLIVFADVAGDRTPENKGIHFLSMPVGPHKLARVLRDCLDSDLWPPSTKLAPGSAMTGPLEAGPLIPVPQAPEPGRLSPESPAEYTVEPRKPNLQSSVEAPALEQVFRPKNMPFGTAKMLSTERPAPSDYHHSPPPTPAPLPPLLVPAARTKVLLVEDNIVNLRVLIQFMKAAKQDYVTANNGLEALEKFQTEARSFKIIFMDLSMPVMDGLTSTRHIRAFEAEHKLPRTRIVALTCFSSDQYQKDAKESGIDLYVVKPVPMKSLRPILAMGVDDFVDTDVGSGPQEEMNSQGGEDQGS